MNKVCAYCGGRASTFDHVVPKGLYPMSARKGNIQLLTVPACTKCNESYSDDEEHFRNVITCLGENLPLVSELFYDKVNASFVKGKSLRHLRQLVDLMKAYENSEGKRYVIYPMKDERFVRILKKIFRGLAFHHFGCQISEENIWIDVLKYVIPQGLLDNVIWYNYQPNIFEYIYEIYEVENSYKSCWFLKIFKTRNFIGIIDMRENMDFDKEICVKLWQQKQSP